MFKKVYSLYSAFCTQPAFYSQPAVCFLLLVRSLQSAVRSLYFTLTVSKTASIQRKLSPFFNRGKNPFEGAY